MTKIGARLYRSSYLVLPRLAIEAMPESWQDRLEDLLQEADDAGMSTPDYYVFRSKEDGACDPLVRGLKNVSEDPSREFLIFTGRVGKQDPWADYRYGQIKSLCPTFKRKDVVVKPSELILHCPMCKTQHIDSGVWSTRPHKTHRCEDCEHEWRVASFPTVGVKDLTE